METEARKAARLRNNRWAAARRKGPEALRRIVARELAAGIPVRDVVVTLRNTAWWPDGRGEGEYDPAVVALMPLLFEGEARDVTLHSALQSIV